MYCKNCGAELKEGQQICLSCGFAVGKGNKYCANCGEEVKTQGQEICLKCGHKLSGGSSLGNLSSSASWVPAGKDKLIAILLCLFLGGLGIHNFYLGETKKGVVRIVANLLLVGGIILAIIDFVKMLMDNYTVDPNAYI